RDRDDEPRELVDGVERLLHRGDARDAEMVTVRLDRVDDVPGHAGLFEDRLAVLRMAGGISLVVEVVQQAGDAPGLLVLTELRREVPHRRLDGEAVLAQAVRS